MIFKVKKIHPEAKLPSYAHSNDAGMDLYSLEDITVSAGKSARIRSGISLEIPEGYAGLCWDKSGLSMNHGVKVLAGVIDPGFRGEVVMAVFNLGKEDYTFKKGDKVMQMLVQKVENVEIMETDALSESERGEKGFGSTGK
ncbi:MAG: dUTP diphosphatase [Patescibacteria group bacterium]